MKAKDITTALALVTEHQRNKQIIDAAKSQAIKISVGEFSREIEFVLTAQFQQAIRVTIIKQFEQSNIEIDAKLKELGIEPDEAVANGKQDESR